MSPTVVAKRSSKKPTTKSKSAKTKGSRAAGAARGSTAKKGKAAARTTARKATATTATKTTAPKATPKAAAARKAAPKATAAKVRTRRVTVKTTVEISTRGVTSRKPLAEDRPLSPAERKRREQERIDGIWKMYKKTGDENLRNILVEYHFPLVKYIAERLLQTLPKSIELDDLISAGTFGLLDAIRGFDLKRGIKFKTYCSTRIRGSILDELRSQDWVPRLVRLKAHKLDKAVRKLEAQNGGDVNDWELAKEMELSLHELEVLKTEASPKTIFSLSEKLDESDDNRDMEKVEIIEDKKGTDPLQSLHQQDVLDLITSNLTKKERLIIIMYYYEGLTMREIGDIMSLTESRVCQIHSNVMSRLKTQLKSLATEGSAL
ncbi:MAG: FliA/WhiG family RNA polymerase sigma factor [Planctomycetota bacterium]